MGNNRISLNTWRQSVDGLMADAGLGLLFFKSHVVNEAQLSLWRLCLSGRGLWSQKESVYGRENKEIDPFKAPIQVHMTSLTAPLS